MLATITPVQLHSMNSSTSSSMPTDRRSMVVPSESTMSAGSDLAPPRLARLAARNRAGIRSFHAAERTPSDNVASPPTTHLSNDRPWSSADLDKMKLQSTRGAFAGSENLSLNKPAKAKKRRKNSVFGFLTLKEPSGVAWDDYSRQQKKAAAAAASAAQDGRTTVVKVPQRSSQQLLDRVPKADGNWDVPSQEASNSIDQQKRRERPSRPSLSTGRMNHRTTLSSVSDGPHSPKLMVGTLTSRPQSLAIQRVSFRSSTASRSSSSSGASLRTARKDNPTVQSAIAEEGVVATFLDSPSRPPTTLDHHISSDSSTEARFVSEFRSSPVAAYLSGACVDYSDKIPVDFDSQEPDTPSHMRYPLSPKGNRTVWYSDTDAEDSASDIKLSKQDVPPPPQVIYWSPSKTPPVQTVEEKASEVSDDENWPLPAPPARYRQQRFSVNSQATELTAHTSAISPTFSRRLSDMTQPSSLCSPVQGSDLARLDAPKSNRSSASSAMSAQWTQSPKQRLGLGGTVRKADVLPWEIQEQPVDLARTDDEPADQLRGRLSIMLGRR